VRPWTSLILPEILELLERDSPTEVRTAVEDLLAPDLAEIAEHLPDPAAAKLLTSLDVKIAADALAELPEHRQSEVIEALGRERLGKIVEEMSPDDRADLVKRLPDDTRQAVLPLLAQAERNDVKKLIAFPEGTAGSLMTTDYASLAGDLRVDQALAKLREVAPDSETIYYAYVTDGERRLRGVASLRDIVIALPRKTLQEIMREHPVAVHADDDQEAVAEAFRKYDLTTLPVLDREERLVGIITVDDVLDVIEEEHTEDVQQFGAVVPLEEPYMDTGFGRMVRKRASWLVVLFVGEMLTTNVLAHQEKAFEAVASLVIFIPLIVSSGGNSGSQTATLITRALAMGEIAPTDALKIISREVLIGLSLGAILGLVGLIRAGLGGYAGISHVVGLALVLIVISGTVIGAAIPLALKRLGLDPAVSSAPLIASLVDVIGIFVYFKVAKLMLGI
jgi:magnesium transporter